MQVVVSGRHAIVTPLALDLRLCRRPDIDAVGGELTALGRLVSASGRTCSVPPCWTARTKRLRDALIALDGHRAGASLREIAIVIYGRERVERDWPERGVKQRLRRDLNRGLALCSGGYHDLLR